MAIKLYQVFIPTEVKETLQTQYNTFFTASDKILGDAEAQMVTNLIYNRLINLMRCDTIYKTVEEGKEALTIYLQANILALIRELHNTLDSFNKEVAKTHNVSNFDPIDNEDLDKMKVQSDDQSYSYAQLMLGHIDFLRDNCAVLNILYQQIWRDCITIGE